MDKWEKVFIEMLGVLVAENKDDLKQSWLNGHLETHASSYATIARVIANAAHFEISTRRLDK